MSNGKTIRDAMKAAKDTPKKDNPFKGVIYDPRGQWAFPGEVTKIPSNRITMQGVPYPVYGEDDQGYGQMMYPGMDYSFPGQYVTEYPMAQNGLSTSVYKKPIKPLEQILAEKKQAEENAKNYRAKGLQATSTYASGKEQNTLESMPVNRRNYEQTLADQIAQQELRDARSALDMAGIVFWPAAAGSSALDAAEENYSGAGLGLVPWVGRAGRHGKLWGKAYTKAINAGVPHSVAHPAKHFLKGITAGTAAGLQGLDTYNDNPYELFHKAYGGDPSLPAITGHYQKGGWLDEYPFGGIHTKTHTHMQEGGWLDEFSHGGMPYTPKHLRKKVQQKGTKKNIQSSINELFLRNYTVFGPAGRSMYNPNSKYKLGGWLDNLE